MLNVCVCCPVISAQQQRSGICYMFVCVVPLSQPSSRDLLYVKCLCVLSRYLSPVVEIWYMLYVCVCCPVISAQQQRSVYVKCLCVLSRYLSPVVEIWYMLNVCVCCPVISAQQQRSGICYMFVCVVPLSQPSSRDLVYVICLCVLSRYLSPVVEIWYMLNVCVCCPVISAQQQRSGYMLYVCVCCPVISAQQQRSGYMFMFVCVVPLSQPSSRDLVYVICLCVLSRYLSPVVEIWFMLYVCVCCPVISAQQQRSGLC